MTRSSQQTYIQRLGFQDKDRANPRHGLACEYLFERLLHREILTNINELACKEIFNQKTQYEQKIQTQQFSVDHAKDSLEYHKTIYEQAFDAGNSNKFIVNAQERLNNEIQKLNNSKEILNFLNNWKSIDSSQLQMLKKIILDHMPASNYINVPITFNKFVNGFADVLLKRRFYPYIEKFNANGETFETVWRVCSYIDAAILGEVKITPEPAETIIQQIAFYENYLTAREVIVLVDYEAPQLKRMTEGSNIKVYRLGEKFEQWCATRSKPLIEEF